MNTHLQYLKRLLDNNHPIAAPTAGVLSQLTHDGCTFTSDTSGIRLTNAGIGIWRDYLNDRHLQHYTEVYDTTSSTQDAAKRYLSTLKPDSSDQKLAIFLADHQTAGRGRQGKTWLDEKSGSVLTSMTLISPAGGHALQRMMMLSAALCVRSILALSDRDNSLPDLSNDIGIKWPNDIMVRLNGEHQFRKLCGILVEHTPVPNSPNLEAFIIGIGINVDGTMPSASKTRLPAATLAEFFQSHRRSSDHYHAIHRLSLIDQLITNLDALKNAEDDELHTVWRRFHILNGKHVQLKSGDRIHEGQVMDTDPAVGILLRLTSGEIITVSPETASVLSWR